MHLLLVLKILQYLTHYFRPLQTLKQKLVNILKTIDIIRKFSTYHKLWKFNTDYLNGEWPLAISMNHFVFHSLDFLALTSLGLHLTLVGHGSGLDTKLSIQCVCLGLAGLD